MKINFKFLLISLAVAASAAVCVFLVHRVQLTRTSDVVLNLASVAANQNRTREAIGFYRRYLGLQPDDSVARAELGKLLTTIGSLETAFFQYERALRNDPTLDEDRQELVKVAMSLGRFADARTHLEQLLPEHPDNAELHWLGGHCDLEKNDVESARDRFRRAFELEKENPDYAGDLVILLTNQFSDVPAAKKVLDELVSAAPKSATALVVRGRWLANRGNQTTTGKGQTRASLREDAWSDAQRAVELEPTSVDAMSLALDVAFSTDRVEQVRPLVARAIEKQPDQFQFYVNASSIELQTDERDRAIEVLNDGLEAIPGQPELMWALAQLELNGDNMPRVEELAAGLRSVDFAEERVAFLEAQILASQGQWRKVIETIEGVREQLRRDTDLLKRAEFLVAGSYRQLGKTDEQINALRRSVDVDPLWARGRQALASALVRAGRSQEASAEFRLVLGQPDPPLSAVLNYARLIFLETLRRDATNPDWRRLREILAKLDEYPEAADDLAVLRAEVLVADDQFDQARKLLRERIKASPDAFALYQALIALHRRDEDWEAAEKVLAEAEQTLPVTPQLRLERARLLVNRDGEQLDLQRLDQVLQPQPDWSEDQRMELAEQAARLFLSLQEFERCEQQARLVTQSDAGDTNLDIHLLVFDLAYRSDNVSRMSDSLERVKAIEGEGPLWRVGQATRLSVQAENLPAEDPKRQKLYAEAINHLTKARKERPGWSRIPRLQAEIRDRQERRDQAVKNYLEAIDLGESDPQMVARVVGLLYSEGKFGEADRVIRKLQEQRISFTSELTQVASQVSLQLQNFDRALDLAKNWAEESDSQQDRLWLAQVYRITGQDQLAREQLRAAIELDRSAPGPWVVLVQTLARIGDVQAAKDVIAEAKSSIKPQERPAALARAYELIKDYPQAEQSYREALEDAPDDWATVRSFANFYMETDRQQQAEPLLNRLVNDTDESNARDRAWARRNLALIFATAEEADVQRARSLIAANRRELGASVDDRRTLAAILATRTDRSSMLEAIAILERMVKEQSRFSLRDQFLLAELYLRRARSNANEEQGETFEVTDWSRYNRAMRRVLANGGADEPRYLQRYVDALVEKEEFVEAKVWQKRLRNLAPDQLATDTVEARLLFASKDFDRLLSLLESKAESSDTVLWAANGAEAFGEALRTAGADAEAKRYLEKAAVWFGEAASPESELEFVQANFFARIGEVEKALQVLEGKSPARINLAEIAEEALQSNRLTADEAKRLLAVLEPMLDQYNPDPVIGVIVGDLHTWRGDWQNAMRTYQAVRDANQGNLAALNNLAYVLSHTRERLDVAQNAIAKAFAQGTPPDALYDTRGSLRLALSDPEGAEADFRVALQSRITPSRLLHLATALFDQGEIDEARAAMRQAIKRGAKREEVHPIEQPAFDRLYRQLIPSESEKLSSRAIQ